MPNSKILPQEIFQRREELGLKNSISLLIKIIETDPNDNKRQSAIKYLGLISNDSALLKKESFKIFENLLISDNNIDIKCEAAKALGKSRHESALKPLKWTLEQEPIEMQVKISVLKAIRKIRFQIPEIQLFIKELDSNYQSIKELVKNQLLTLDPETLIKILLESLKDDIFSENHKKEAIILIGLELSSINISFQDSSFLEIKYPKIISMLNQHRTILLEAIVPNLKEENLKLMNSVLTIFKLLGNEINDDLIGFLRYDDFIIKKNAIKLIGKLHVKEGVNLLLENLDNMYEEVSKASIEALGEIGEILAVPELLKVLDIEDVHYEYIDLDFKFYILDAIKKIYQNNKDASFNFLYSKLETDNDVLKESVAYILGEIAYEEFIAPLLKLLNEKNFDTRKNAIIALGKIGNKGVIEPLLNIVKDPNNYWLLKKVAVDALYNIYIKNLYAKVNKSAESERSFVIYKEKLIDYLNNNLDENFKVKLSLIKFLGVFGDNSALNALLRQVNDFQRVVRIAASKAIKKIEKRLEDENEN
ncbi:MAG: HEAT repeat domain-containing protein [Promethearchaeota archaeon]